MGPEHSIFFKKISSDPNVKLELKNHYPRAIVCSDSLRFYVAWCVGASEGWQESHWCQDKDQPS